MKKRILALSLAAAMLVGAMASCSAKEEVVSSQAVEARDISLVLWGSENDNAFLKETAAEWATAYAAEHEDVKSVTVDVQIKGEDVATTDALNDMSAAADVFGCANDQLAQLTASNAIYKMPESVVNDIKAVVGDSFLASTMCDGSYYGFPYAPNTAEILFYNKEFYTDEEAKSLNAMLEKDLGGVTNLAVDIDDQSWNSMTWFATAGAELYTGAFKSGIEKDYGQAEFAATFFRIYPIGEALKTYAQLRADLERRGERLDNMDLFIASTALEHQLVLVTGNGRHFARIPDLVLEDWIAR